MRTLTVMTALAALALLAPGSSAQTPANCNANLFDQAIARDKIEAKVGETVNYTVGFVNRSALPPPSIQVGCNVLGVTANFRCPGPSGAPDGPASNLVTNQNILANNVITTFGPFACVMPDVTGTTIVLAGVFGTGDLDDGGPSPFLINKTISVNVTSVVVPPPAQIPTLSQGVFIGLGGLMLVVGLVRIRKKRSGVEGEVHHSP